MLPNLATFRHHHRRFARPNRDRIEGWQKMTAELTFVLLSSLTMSLRPPFATMGTCPSLHHSFFPAKLSTGCVGGRAGCKRAGLKLAEITGPRPRLGWIALEAKESTADSDEEHASEAANTAISEQVVEELRSKGYAIVDDAVSMDTVDQFLVGAEGMEKNGKLQTIPEQVSLGREDKIMVMDVWNPDWGPIPDHFKGVADACEMMKGLAHAINRHSPDKPWGSLSAPPFFQLAVYDGVGAKYVRHIDNDPEDPAAQEGPPGLRICDRAVTALLYFNKDWKEEDGGYLRLYKSEPGLEEEVLEEVAPTAGRMILFESKKFFHEVLPSFRRRWALSAWINGDV